MGNPEFGTHLGGWFRAFSSPSQAQDLKIKQSGKNGNDCRTVSESKCNPLEAPCRNDLHSPEVVLQFQLCPQECLQSGLVQLLAPRQPFYGTMFWNCGESIGRSWIFNSRHLTLVLAPFRCSKYSSSRCGPWKWRVENHGTWPQPLAHLGNHRPGLRSWQQPVGSGMADVNPMVFNPIFSKCRNVFVKPNFACQTMMFDKSDFFSLPCFPPSLICTNYGADNSHCAHEFFIGRSWPGVTCWRISKNPKRRFNPHYGGGSTRFQQPLEIVARISPIESWLCWKTKSKVLLPCRNNPNPNAQTLGVMCHATK